MSFRGTYVRRQEPGSTYPRDESMREGKDVAEVVGWSKLVKTRRGDATSKETKWGRQGRQRGRGEVCRCVWMSMLTRRCIEEGVWVCGCVGVELGRSGRVFCVVDVVKSRRWCQRWDLNPRVRTQ